MVSALRKGAKHGGKEKLSSAPKNSSEQVDRVLKGVDNRKRSISSSSDLDKLPPLCSIPKEGDVIAYRLLELSSTGTPELSSLRVGRVSFYGVDTCQLVLVPVPEHPIVSEKMDEDGTDNFPYGDNIKDFIYIVFQNFGPQAEVLYLFQLLIVVALKCRQIFHLIDVRILKQSDSQSSKVVNQEVNQTPPVSNGAIANAHPSSTISKTHASNQGNGEVNLWDEISETLTAKKAELSEDSNWIKESSKRDLWSYRAVHLTPGCGSRKGSAIGPTMAMLRAKNNI